MNLRIKSFFTAALLAFGFASTPALSQDIGWYMGGSIGQSKFDAPPVIGATTLTSEDDDTGFKIYGGYQFNRNLAVEIGYVDFGTISQRGTPGPFTINYDVTGVTAAAVGTLPLNGNFSVFGKAGLIAVHLSATATGPVLVRTEDGTELLVGIGARYNLNRNLAIQVEWERFGGDIETDFLSLGLRYKF